MDSFGSKIPFFFNISHQSIEKVPAGKYRFRKSSTENLKDFWLIYFPLLNIQNVQIVWGNDLKKGKNKQKKKKNAKCHFTKITNKSLNTYSIVRLCQ